MSLESDSTLPHKPAHATSLAHQNDLQTRDEVETARFSSIAEDTTDSASVASGSGLESLQSIGRPNKYRGPSSTWRSWTESERQLATSLDQERAADLAIHLYNSHALKQRLWQSEGAGTVHDWRSKERWHVPKGPLGTEAVGDGQGAFNPQKGWTAWPMKPELVPREGQVISPQSGREIKGNWKHQYGGKMEDPKSSEVLEDCIFGGVLSTAKERYQERVRGHTRLGNEGKSCSPSSSGLHSPALTLIKERNTTKTNDSMAMGGHQRGRGSSSSSVDSDVSQHPSVPYSGLVPMADDEKAHNLLRPMTRHLLSKLDSLLIGLHHAREAYLSSSDEKAVKSAQKHLKVGLPGAVGQMNTPTKLPTRQNHRRPAKKGRGRPPKHPRVSTDSTGSVIQDDNVLDNSVLAAREQKRKAGRPRKYPKGFEKYQTYYMMRKLAGGSKTNSGSSLDITGNESVSDSSAESEGGSSSHLSYGISRTPPSSVKKRRVTGNPATKACHSVKKQGQLGLRDWSDVLGVASMVGWEPEAVGRAAARCSTLFGEGISFRTLAEEETFLGDGRIVEYRPNMVSPPVIDGKHVEARPKGHEKRPLLRH